MRYNNYHKHDHYGNPWYRDVIVKPKEYCDRAVELGHTTVFTTNHGVTGNIFDWIEESKSHNLKMIYGTETYFVKDRFEKDRSNKHLIIIAKNNDGVIQLNDILTEAHQTGFYYRPRIDHELLFSLDSNNFIITSACIAGIWDDHELLLALKQKFGNNFFLEVQSHNIEKQKEVNKHILRFSQESGISIIHANDSHYILPQDVKYRDIYLRGHEQFFAEEDGMILDYPNSNEILKRYERQGVLNQNQVEEALENTLIFDECEEITLINDDIKLPSISESPNEDLKKIINDRWVEERKSIPKEKHKQYLKAIREEIKVIEETNMANYFLIDYYVVKKAQEEYGGKLTNTGRGSAPSFYTTKMLGLTDIDRVSSPITLFPSRFMSTERILGSRSLPDIDLNTTDREPFIKATEDLLGAEKCAWMLTWKPLQNASAFRLYCKGIGKHISEYDDVAKDLDAYRNDKKWEGIIKESERFVGVIDSVSESPCSMLLYDKPVRKELGLVRTSKGKLCCLLDGYNCDKYKYLKNDYLTVTVWAIIKDVCSLINPNENISPPPSLIQKEAGIPIPSIKELDNLLDEKTFEIYEKGLTCTINQADSDYATNLVMRYKPKNISEMSAFVAIIRPGCASLLQDFIDRRSYSTGIQELDNLLIEGNHRMIYQELIMKYLIWLGVPETGSYDIIKKIAKKKFKEDELTKLKKKLIKGWLKKVGTEEGFIETWTVVEQAAKYSFNASHSLSYAYDSLYGAYLKSHYPLEYYTVALNYYSNDDERTPRLIKELSSFSIKLKPIKFRYSKSGYSLSREDKSIYKGISSIKYMNSIVADEMYELRNNSYYTFIDLLYDLKEKTSLNSRQLDILIKLDFFDEFGDANYLLKLVGLFNELYGKVQIKKDKVASLGIDVEIVKDFAGKETEKMFTKLDSKELLFYLSQCIKVKPRTLKERIAAQIEHLGYLDITDPKYSRMVAVISVDTKYSPKLKLYSLKNGNLVDCKIDKRTFNKNKLAEGDIIRIIRRTTKPKSKWLGNGDYEPIPNTSEMWITNYQKVENL